MELNISIGRRLREERERLGMTQTEFSAVAQATRQTQSNYEKGERAPDALYLAAIVSIGVDVQYILTGLRAAGVKVHPQPYANEVNADPLNRRRQHVKAIVDQLDEKGLEEVQFGVEKIKRMKDLEEELADLKKKIS
jgi:transcriptional regulator with XRE-family HTH domain